jgi:phosphatidate cytidylyltransferase
VVSGVILIALVLAAIFLKGVLLMALVALAAGLAAHELYTIARRAGYNPWYPAGMALALLLALRGYLGGGEILSGVVYTGPPSGVELLVVAGVFLFTLARQVALTPNVSAAADGSTTAMQARGGWADVGITLGGALYTGGLLGYAPLLAALPEGADQAGGTAWLLLVLVGTAACDTGAYFVGSLMGRRKLIPHISPAKTWEGLAGGVLGAVVAAVALSGLLKLSILAAALLGLALCAAAVAGDLAESLIKRAAGVKDSGSLIPGHGGVLDRIDSTLFVLVTVYWFVILNSS